MIGQNVGTGDVAMRIGYLDACAGLSGDMMLGAMVDAGLPLEVLERAVAALGLGHLHLETERVTKVGIAATRFTARAAHEHSHGDAGHPHGRSAAALRGIIETSKLDAEIAERAVTIINRLAEAEARIHDSTPDQVHFHELGGLDTVVDIVGAVVGLRELGIDRLHCSALPLGRGYVECAHGRMPLPAPATLELLRGIPTVPLEIEGETVTPTGAALAASLCDEFGPAPPMTVDRVGYGAGASDFDPVPNVARLWLGEPWGSAGPAEAAGLMTDTVVELEANVDDMTPELVPDAMQAVMEAGALDVWVTPITMKKGRPALMVSALAAPGAADAVAEAMLRETTTLGVRMVTRERRCLRREQVVVRTDYGEVRVKVGYLGARAVTASPEYEDCRRAAEDHDVSVKQVYAAAAAAFHAQRDKE